jgi:hypothetical protein
MNAVGLRVVKLFPVSEHWKLHRYYFDVVSTGEHMLDDILQQPEGTTNDGAIGRAGE